MTIELPKEEKLPKIGEPYQELRNGRFKTLGHVVKVVRRKRFNEVTVR